MKDDFEVVHTARCERQGPRRMRARRMETARSETHGHNRCSCREEQNKEAEQGGVSVQLGRDQ